MVQYPSYVENLEKNCLLSSSYRIPSIIKKRRQLFIQSYKLTIQSLIPSVRLHENCGLYFSIEHENIIHVFRGVAQTLAVSK